MKLKRKLYSVLDEEKLFSVEEERMYARGKNIRNLGKGNKKLNKKLGRKELIDAGKADAFNETFITIKSGERLNGEALKEAAKISDARFNRKPLQEQMSHALTGRTSRSFDELNYNNLKNRDSFYYKSKLKDLRKKKQAAIAELRDSRLAKVKELKAKKLHARNAKIGAGIVAGTAVLGTGAYLAKKHHDKKKEEKN